MKHLDKVDNIVKKKVVETKNVKYHEMPVNVAARIVRHPRAAKRQAQFKLDITGHKHHEY